MTTTDFQAWLDQADLDGHEEIYNLYRAIVDVDHIGTYSCSMNNGKYFVKGEHVEDTLMLASEKAKDAFLIEFQKGQGIEGDIEGWYSYKRAMSKDD